MRFDEALFIMESTARKKELRSHPAVHNGVLTMKKLAKEMAITMSGAKGENLVSRTLEYLNRPNTQIFRNVYITDGIDETELDGIVLTDNGVIILEVKKVKSDLTLTEDGRMVFAGDECYIRLTNLIPEILDMVDEKKIAFNPAVELSYLKPSEQKEFLEAMDYAQASPSLSQAQRLKKLSQEGGCTLDVMCEVMNEIKKDELDHVTIKNEVLRKYFPKSYTPKQMQDTIIRLLEKWQRSKQRDMER